MMLTNSLQIHFIPNIFRLNINGKHDLNDFKKQNKTMQKKMKIKAKQYKEKGIQPKTMLIDLSNFRTCKWHIRHNLISIGN